MKEQDSFTNKLTFQLAMAKLRLKKAEEEAKDAKKYIEQIEGQIKCDHDWVSDGSGMQLEISHCRKCGAIDAV